MPETSQLSINLATVRARYEIGEILDAVARHGIPAVAPWRDQIASIGLKETSKRIRDLGLKVSGVCRGGMFPTADKAAYEANLEDNVRAVEEAAELDAACLVLVVGGIPEGSKDLIGARTQVRDGIAWLNERAQDAGVKLAIEPLHPMYCADRAVVNTMAHALDICDDVGGDVGVACDVYHVWWDPQLDTQIERAGKARLHAFHICDWLRTTSDMLLDRGMMGDGVIDIPPIRRKVEAQGFDGFHEVEIFSKDNWWKRDIDDVLSTCIERHQTCC
ncbi:MAG: sugar phosphate isomerase/epimerase [Geminicoccaceae bacterium]|nr:sugar phosphate isomerase/epimerase [Geminicoccaceae bacterium]